MSYKRSKLQPSFLVFFIAAKFIAKKVSSTKAVDFLGSFRLEVLLSL